MLKILWKIGVKLKLKNPVYLFMRKMNNHKNQKSKKKSKNRFMKIIMEQMDLFINLCLKILRMRVNGKMERKNNMKIEEKILSQGVEEVGEEEVEDLEGV